MAHCRSFVMSDLSNSLTDAHLSWATWAIRSRTLICLEQSERIAHSRSFDLSEMSEWANSQPCLYICVFCHFYKNVSSRAVDPHSFLRILIRLFFSVRIRIWIQLNNGTDIWVSAPIFSFFSFNKITIISNFSMHFSVIFFFNFALLDPVPGGKFWMRISGDPDPQPWFLLLLVGLVGW